MQTETRPSQSAEVSLQVPALVVDLDGTLVKSDLLLESLVALVRQRPWCVFSLPLWLLKGRAYFKQQIASRISLDVGLLPYREELLDYLKVQRARGRKIVLATGSDIQVARKVAGLCEPGCRSDPVYRYEREGTGPGSIERYRLGMNSK